MDKQIENRNESDRYEEVRSLIFRKSALKKLYAEAYAKYSACLDRSPQQGLAIELGSGAGFAKEVIPDLIHTDIIPYPYLDQIVDATQMPFADQSLRAILMQNVFHHIPDVEAFLREADRCLIPGGRILMVDQNPGWISSWILKYAHHEPFLPQAKDWKFETTGPLSGANGALAWIVFKRDFWRFTQEFPNLNLERFEPHTPLRYWLAGGLRSWSLLPGFVFGLATFLDQLLIRISPHFGSFVDIELVKKCDFTFTLPQGKR